MIVRNYASSVTSDPVTVTVLNSPPRITVAPVDLRALAGQRVDLVAAFKGSLPMTFQWEHDGSPVSGATSATLTLAGMSADLAGAYRVTATNAFGAVRPSPSSSPSCKAAWKTGRKSSRFPHEPGQRLLSQRAFHRRRRRGNGRRQHRRRILAVGAQGDRRRFDGGRFRGTLCGRRRRRGGLTSDDGAAWVAGSSGVTTDFTEITYGNGLFVAITGTTALTSADGITWTPHEINSALVSAQVAFGNGRFAVAGLDAGYRAHTYFSADRQTWTASSFDAYANGCFISFGDGVFWLSDSTWLYTSADGAA